MTQQPDCFSDLLCPSVPSRTVISSTLQDGLLKQSIFASNAFVYHFDDIRDAIDLVLKRVRGTAEDKHEFANNAIISTQGISDYLPATKATSSTFFNNSVPQVFHLNHTRNRLKMNELFESDEVHFACSRFSEALLNSRSGLQSVTLPSATLLISIKFLIVGDENSVCDSSVQFERVDVVADALKKVISGRGGPVLAYSELRRNTREGGRIFKFFAEFYRVEHCERFFASAAADCSASLDRENIHVSFERVSLYDVDREALFFCGTDDSRVTSPTATAEICTESELGLNHQRESPADQDDFITGSLSASSSSFGGSAASGVSSTHFEINLWKIEKGLDRRTTCMIRNIPNKYSQQMIFELVNETHAGCFDFLYLRMDFRNRCNVGYAFINFTRPEHIVSFAARVHGKRWARFNSDKVCNLTFARIQGLGALIEKFRASKVMFEAPAYRPKLFHTEGPMAGHEIPFPTSNH